MTLLIGEAGTGKSTLLRAALASDKCRHVKVALIDDFVLVVSQEATTDSTPL